MLRETRRQTCSTGPLVAALVLFAPSLASAVMYTVIKIGPPPGALGTLGHGLNIHAQAVGQTDASLNHGFFWNGGPTVDIGTLPGGSTSFAFGINAAGQVVGLSSTDGPFGDGAFLWTPGAGIMGLGMLPGDVGSVAAAINDAGQIVGVSEGATFGDSRCFLWENGVMTNLIPSMSPCAAAGINASGQVAGSSGGFTTNARAFLYTGGVVTALPPFPGDDYDGAAAINDLGHVAGTSVGVSTVTRAFLYHDGLMQPLAFEDGSSNWASGLNNHDQVIGGGNGRPFVYDATGMHQLQGLIVQPVGAEWTLFEADAINDAGQILAYGNIEEPPGSAPHSYAVLLDPIGCGDGKLDPGEACDDGPDNGSDHRCTSDCTIADGDGDGIVDADDPCTNLNGVSITHALLSVTSSRRLHGGRLRFVGSLELPSAAEIDVGATGLRILLADSAGGAFVDATIPAGDGWRATPQGWRYRSVDSSTRALVMRTRRSADTLAFLVELRGRSYAPPPVVEATVVFDPPTALTGECGEAVLREASCATRRRQNAGGRWR